MTTVATTQVTKKEILYIAINLLMILSIQNLSKKYRKEKFGLKDFSITIENGILGLLGPNGAGKSTLMKIIATDQPAYCRNTYT
jgi:ATPase subunit of ABC transporter with duplicated ATPase domains